MGSERMYPKFIQVLARIVRVLWILGAAFFGVSAFVVAPHRIVYAIVSVFLLVTGIAFLRARPIRPADLARLPGTEDSMKEKR